MAANAAEELSWAICEPTWIASKSWLSFQKLRPAGTTDLVYGDRDAGGSSSPAAAAGYPNITVPAGHFAGLPVGISFFGPAFSEPKLLALAFAFEQSNRARKPPRFFPTVG